MIEIGKYNTLKILRDTSVGLYLGDGTQDVLLPNKYVPKFFEIGEEIDVFCYLDNEGRLISTTLKPFATLNEFAMMTVREVSMTGAFLDWGIHKDLLVPYREQVVPMREGDKYLVYIYMDKVTNRIVASSRINKFLNNETLTVKEEDEVELRVINYSDLGMNVIINNQHRGLVYNNMLFGTFRIGEVCRGYIKTIREDNKIDVSLTMDAYLEIEPNAQYILNQIKQNNGFLALNDNSDPEEIKQAVGISKKSFKKAVGLLYKKQLITLTDDGLKLVEQKTS